jgi:hypothetical protein
MKLETFILLNFIVGTVSDIILNDLSRSSISNPIIKSLEPYFLTNSIIEAGIYAGITVVAVIIPVIYVTQKIFNYTVPTTSTQLLYTVIVSFILGFVADILIDKLQIFGSSLDNYYKIAGAGLWGAIAISFSALISYILQKYLLPKL